MRIRYIHAINYLSFTGFLWGEHCYISTADVNGTIDPNFNVLVGPNGAGKTNVFKLLRAVTEILDRNRRRPSSRWGMATHHGGANKPYRLELGLEFDAPKEQRLLTSFIRASLCNGNELSRLFPSVAVTTESLSKLSYFLQSEFKSLDLLPLFDGRLVLMGGGDQDRWTIWYESISSNRPFRLELDGGIASTLSSDPTRPISGSKTVTQAWLESLSAEDWDRTMSYLQGGEI